MAQDRLYSQPTPFRPVQQAAPVSSPVSTLQNTAPSDNAALIAAMARQGPANTFWGGVGQGLGNLAVGIKSGKDSKIANDRRIAIADLLANPNLTREQYIRGMALAGNTAPGVSYAKERFSPEESVTLAEGASLVGKRTGKKIASNKKSPTITDLWVPGKGGNPVKIRGYYDPDTSSVVQVGSHEDRRGEKERLYYDELERGKIPMTVDPKTGKERSQTYTEWELSKAAASSDKPSPDDWFNREAAKAEGKRFSAIVEAGTAAGPKINDTIRLQKLLEEPSTQGAEGKWKQILGAVGIPSEGLSEIQAAQALISKMVPQQRPVGSGTMSDKDLEEFKNSLPKIINQPGGNRLIIQTVLDVHRYDQRRGEIAHMALSGKIDRDEAQVMINKLESPLTEYNRILAEVRAGERGTPSTIENDPLGLRQ